MTWSDSGCRNFSHCAFHEALRLLLTVAVIAMFVQSSNAQFRLKEPDAKEPSDSTESKPKAPKLTAPILKKKPASKLMSKAKAAPRSQEEDGSDGDSDPVELMEPMDVTNDAEVRPTGPEPDESETRKDLSNGSVNLRTSKGIAESTAIELIVADPAAPEFFSGPIPRTSAILEDAALRDVCQVGEFCCAVGDRGVICLSSDGGEKWSTQAAPFECHLRSVCFLTNRVGWIGGFRHRLGSAELLAVILETRDGGVTWKKLNGPKTNGQGSSITTASSLPGIVHLEYFGLEEAIAVTFPSERHGGNGIFRSVDGGMTWSVLQTDQPVDRLAAADFLSLSEGIIGGARECLATIVADQAVVMNEPRRSLRELRGASLDDKSVGWIVGDGASILMTEDAGVTWRVPPGSLPDGFTNLVDLRSVTHRDAITMAAGSPGSFALRSDDYGASWKIVAIPANGLIHKIRFATETNVFAVGSFGQILRSIDQGFSWECVRSANKRVGVLNLTNRSSDASWQLLTRVAAEDGIRSAVVQFSQPFEEFVESKQFRWNDSAFAAVTSLGVCDAASDWMFARTKPELDRSSTALLAEWDRQTDGRLRELLPLRLARELRIWRPSVVVIESAEDRTTNDDAVATILRDALPRAIELAQDPDHDLFSQLQLSECSVSRVVARSSSEVQSPLTFSDMDVLPRLGTTIGLLSDSARAIAVSQTISERTGQSSHYEISFDQESIPSAKSLFDGIVKSLDSSSRRRVDPKSPENEKRIQKVVTTAKLEASSLVGNIEMVGGDGTLIAHMETIGASLPEPLAIRQLRELGELNLQQDNMDGYLAVQQEITRRFPANPAAKSAAEVLLLFYSSAEARRFRLKGELSTPTEQPVDGQLAKKSAPLVAGPFASNATNQLAALNQRWDEHAATAYRLLTSQQPHQDNTAEDANSTTALRPDVLLRQAANLRNLGLAGEHSAMLADISRMPEPFGRFARAEMQIMNVASIPELPTFNVPRRNEQPFLDGTLTDPMWEVAEEIRLHSVSLDASDNDEQPQSKTQAGDLSSLVMIGSDEEHLYVAGVFQMDESFNRKVTLATHRSHDAEHDLRDRFELEIDTDRDYSTAFHFCIDESGLTSDRCWMLNRWDPQWYVEVKRDARSWRFEAAIPLRELAVQQPRLGTVWAIRLRRIQPGAHSQELTSASKTSTSGTGLIRFIRPKASTPK